jgi:transcriptional regulator with GAF, ATPase, and Fis domain
VTKPTPRAIRDRASTLRDTPAVNVAPLDQALVVVVNGVVSTHPLPALGMLTLGRARECDIQIVDPSVSRNHARIRVGSVITIEDLKSANGTRLRGEPLLPGKPVAFTPGESVELGSAIVMLRRRAAPTREWRIWAHGYFEARLEDETARAARTSLSFALLRLRVDDGGHAEVVQQVLATTLRADDVVGMYGPGDYEVLLVERSAAEADSVDATLRKALEDVGLAAHIALVVCPRDGRSADRLVARAGSLLRGDEEVERRAGRLVVRSLAMRRLYELVERVAPGEISVLVLGDTGVGKEVLDEEIHRLSPRRDKSFLRLNCAALSESLLESELFGHERGAFTGAHQTKAGLLETAQGGTVFLDEIGELPMAMQVKLLRVLEERQVWRVGGVKPRGIDVRFVAATNRDLEAEIRRGAFRQDLFFRLNGVSISIPPLRERPEEIQELTKEFVEQLSSQQGRAVTPDLGPTVMDLLLQYSWPGNIRELRNAIERAVLLAGNGPILREHFAVEKMTSTVSTLLGAPSPALRTPESGRHFTRDGRAPHGGNGFEDEETSLGDRLRQQVKEVERQHIMDALSRCGGNQTRAARELGISRRTLITRLEEYNIPRPLKDRREDG